jgi:hypothetical protein
MGDGQALDHPVRRAEFDLRHHPQDDMNSGILERKSSHNVLVAFEAGWRRPAGAMTIAAILRDAQRPGLDGEPLKPPTP